MYLIYFCKKKEIKKFKEMNGCWNLMLFVNNIKILLFYLLNNIFEIVKYKLFYYFIYIKKKIEKERSKLFWMLKLN